MVILFIAACLVLIGFFFRTMRWTGAEVLIFSGCISIVLINMIKYMSRRSADWFTFLKMAAITVLVLAIGQISLMGSSIRILFISGVLALTAVLLKIAIGFGKKQE